MNGMMNRVSDMKSFFRFLDRNRFYTFINVFGLSVSLMFVILIAVYTSQELSVDDFQQKAGRIYIFASEDGPGSAYRLSQRLQERYPEIETACAVLSSKKTIPVVMTDDRRIKADLTLAESTFFDVFSFELVSGDRRQVIAARNGAVVSESFAGKAFPGEDPVGKVILLYDSLSVTVNGVMKDIRHSAVPYGDILLRIENVSYFNEGLASETYGNYGEVVVYLLERENADLRAKEADMLAWLKENVWVYKNDYFHSLLLTPLREIYFTDLYAIYKGALNGYIVNFGNRSFVTILIWVGILILLFAVINYINLTVAQAGFRAREMAMRRLLGSRRSELFVRLIMESTLLCAISFAVGLAMAAAFAPYAGNLVERSLDLAAAATPAGIAAVAGMILLLGAVSGLLPAAVISNARPVEVVRGSFRRKTKMIFSRGFITFQHVITIALLAASITMIAQVEHLTKAPLGYRTENLIDISLMSEYLDRNTIRLLAGELERLPAVKRIGLSEGTPFNRGNNHTVHQDGRNISFQSFVCDSAFFDMIGWQKLRENNVSGESYYLNERALAELEIGEDATTFLFYGQEKPIAGIIRDFQLHNITNAPSPVMVRVCAGEDVSPWNMVVEVSGDPRAAYRAVQDVFERVTRNEFGGKFIDQQVAASFEAERRTSRLMTLFTAVAILISLLGLLAMSTYFIRLRAKEIAIRKVFGSTSAEALRRLVTTFLSYVLIAFAIAAPVTWYLMFRWLSGYSYRIQLSPWIFVAAGMCCLLASFITVFFQSHTAANTNPVKNIKTE
ncbi:MAG: ABC transporter permease [Tannerella sp.]|nr:ABC transporter permease [Tannerella sp.]